MQYRCDECGCYLDPAEYRLCDECREKIRSRRQVARRVQEAVRLSDAGQYQMKLQEVMEA